MVTNTSLFAQETDALQGNYVETLQTSVNFGLLASMKPEDIKNLEKQGVSIISKEEYEKSENSKAWFYDGQNIHSPLLSAGDLKEQSEKLSKFMTDLGGEVKNSVITSQNQLKEIYTTQEVQQASNPQEAQIAYEKLFNSNNHQEISPQILDDMDKSNISSGSKKIYRGANVSGSGFEKKSEGQILFGSPNIAAAYDFSGLGDKSYHGCELPNGQRIGIIYEYSASENQKMYSGGSMQHGASPVNPEFKNDGSYYETQIVDGQNPITARYLVTDGKMYKIPENPDENVAKLLDYMKSNSSNESSLKEKRLLEINNSETQSSTNNQQELSISNKKRNMMADEYDYGLYEQKYGVHLKTGRKPPESFEQYKNNNGDKNRTIHGVDSNGKMSISENPKYTAWKQEKGYDNPNSEASKGLDFKARNNIKTPADIKILQQKMSGISIGG